MLPLVSAAWMLSCTHFSKRILNSTNAHNVTIFYRNTIVREGVSEVRRVLFFTYTSGSENFPLVIHWLLFLNKILFKNKQLFFIFLSNKTHFFLWIDHSFNESCFKIDINDYF